MKVQNAIVCDHVRKEDNGKHLIIGVYPNDILVPDFPATIAPVLWIQLIWDETAREMQTEFRVRRDDGEVLASGKGLVGVQDTAKTATFSLPPTPITIESECTLVFQMRKKKGRWKTLRETEVRRQENTD